MINDILLNIVFFAAFSLNASFLCVSVIEVIFELAILIISFAQLAALFEWMMIFVYLEVLKVCILAIPHF